jgi:ubiquitin C-terminal hydrolase
MIAGLADVLANRKKFVDEVSEVGSGIGTGSKESHQFHSKFANISFIEKSETGCVGLQNQGATCYLNSLIQSLFMLPEFRKAIYSFQYDQLKHGDESSCLTRQLQVNFIMISTVFFVGFFLISFIIKFSDNS